MSSASRHVFFFVSASRYNYLKMFLTPCFETQPPLKGARDHISIQTLSRATPGAGARPLSYSPSRSYRIVPNDHHVTNACLTDSAKRRSALEKRTV